MCFGTRQGLDTRCARCQDMESSPDALQVHANLWGHECKFNLVPVHVELTSGVYTRY